METYIVDAFTNKAFKGNPAGVCMLTEPISEDLMLSIAQELNLSETAFLTSKGGNNYAIRYFSPIMEIPLCGHATLASSKIVFENTDLKEIKFTTFEKLVLTVKKEGNSICMKFPTYQLEKADVNPKMLEALGLEEINNCLFNKESDILVLEISNTEMLTKLTPNFSELIHTHNAISGVAVTASNSESEYDFQSRFFWPWSGSNEDPVTGVIHTFLAPYWGNKLGETKMKALQSSKRTGVLNLELMEENKMTIKGEAVIVFKGNLLI